MAGLPTDFSWVPSDWFGGPAPAPDPAIAPPGTPPVEAAPVVNPALPESGPAAPPAPALAFPPLDWQAAPDVTSGASPSAPAVAPQAGSQAAPTAPAPAEPLFPFEAPQALQEPFQQASPPGPVDYDFDRSADADRAAAEQLVAQGPEAVAAAGEQQKSAREDYIATQFLDEDRRNRQAAEKNALRWRTEESELAKERLALRQEAAALAKDGVNNDHWWESRSTGQKLAAYVTAIAGGLVSPYHGGRNSGLELIQQAIGQDIDTQKANLSHRRDVLGQRQSILGQLTQANQDMLRSEESVRLAAWENVAQRLEAEAAKLDPRGAAAQRIGVALQNVRQQQAKDAVAADERLFNRKKDVFDMRIRSEQLTEQRRARGAQIAEQRRSRDAEMMLKGFVPDRTRPGGYKYDPSVLPKTGVTPQDFLAIKRGEKLERELTAEERERRIDFRGKFVGMAKSPTEAKQLREQQGYYDTYQKELMELKNMVSNPDGSAKTFYQGPGWQLASNPERDAIGAKARKLLYLEAKINDPNSAVREAEIEFGKDIVPFIQGMTQGGVNPGAKVDQLLRSADTRLTAAYDSILEKPPIGQGSDPNAQAASAVQDWQGARKASESMRQEASVATPKAGLDILRATAAEGTPPEAREEFVNAKLAVLDRWAKDTPYILKDVSPEELANLKSTWFADPLLTPEDITKLSSALDAAIKGAAVPGTVFAGVSEPFQRNYDRARGVENPFDEDEE